jgi:bile acid-coenzyme A ligase
MAAPKHRGKVETTPRACQRPIAGERLMTDVGGTSAVPLGRLPAYHAGRQALHPMLTVEGAAIGYDAFDAATNRIARQLRDSGVGAGDFVALSIPNGLHFYQLAFALWKIGATPVPLSWKLPEPEIRSIVALLRPRLVIATSDAGLGGLFAPQDRLMPRDDVSAEPLPDVELQHWKAVTSGGSTGQPKVIVSHMPGLWDPSTTVFGAGRDATVLNVGPLYHNAPFTNMMWHLFSGAHVVEAGKFDPLGTLELIEQHRVEWISLVPTMMHRIWRLPVEERLRFDLSSLRHVWHMASTCPVWLKEGWIEWLGAERIFELYGGSESTGGTSITGAEWLEHKGSVGKCAEGFLLRVLTAEGRDAAPGEAGEIFMAPVGGRNSTYHYMGSEAKAVDQFESLGDLGFLDKEGYLYLLDRRQDMIVSGGANIYPAEVEGALEAHPDVASSVVVGIADDEWGHRIHALVQLNPGASERVDDTVLAAYMRGRLASYKLPKSSEFVASPLRDDAGKARRSALADAARLRSG